MTRPTTPTKAVTALAGLVFLVATAAAVTTEPDVRLFLQASSLDQEQSAEALEALAEVWRNGYASMLIDVARFLPSSRRRVDWPGGSEDPFASDTEPRDPFGNSPGGARDFRSPQAELRSRLIRFLEKQTGQRFGDDLTKWRQWMWNIPYEPHPDYYLFKAVLYGHVDRRMAEFFPPEGDSLIRLDEVDWGGVGVNGIPPLDHPTHVPAWEATYLDDDNVVFGVALNGETRAYPKRILAWHELARDRIGGVELAIVYCTLCGTVIPYGAEVGGEHRTFGTSGLLYRSNKLMFDEETMSLWSTTQGRPVIGALAGTDLELAVYPVVVTRWEEWRATHPHTTVLSIDTGFERDYSEGAAYREYFRTDRLMFGVPRTDPRLKNKDEVLSILIRPKGSGPAAKRQALALSTKFLQQNRLHHLAFTGHDLVVVTSPQGAHRVYDASGRRFVRQNPRGGLVDSEGLLWELTEEALVPVDGPAEPLPRIAARRAFWFGWYAQFPDTVLIH